ncbi:hypothetical protein [Bdellovibrio bacteriovorus]|uniref:Lipoprotein n=1 Tax=Bdellovibrio bacteriovorus TaxID=959 RepID=A0A1Z3N8Q2_BDEBC|nr:hypothetical protein [Bdellovibrio bacteriovorus]ASD63852.1 hypothetical protein B9G79_09845 [Bdellovibrio bacteriovorus]
MTNSIFKNKMLGVLLLAVLSLSACAKKDSSSVRVAGRTTNTGTTSGGGVSQGGTTASGTCGTSSAGKIFDQYASPQFETQVKNFVSATLDPQSLGSVSGNINDRTGVDLFATFKFDSAGSLVAAESNMLIKIFDSYANQVYNGQVIQPYSVSFSQASEGMIDRNTRQFQVKFRDGYGEIIFQGAYDNSIAEGTVYYQNYTAVAGYQPTSGTLGSFRMYACSLIK